MFRRQRVRAIDTIRSEKENATRAVVVGNPKYIRVRYYVWRSIGNSDAHSDVQEI